MTLDEAEVWANKTQSSERRSVFAKASVTKSEDAAPTSSRAYALSLSPFIVHTRSALISNLVSSRAYRQLEFLAVGTFYIFRQKPGAAEAELTPIPATREAIFATDAIQPRPKRALMKFLKFVLAHGAPESEDKWRSRATEPLARFLEEEFKVDAELRTLILALTLSLDGEITVEQGLKAIELHLTSMGVFGPGFAAIYPKYGGGSEVAQVGCRACAVGGGVYMLGTGTNSTRQLEGQEDGAKHEVELSEGGIKLRTRVLIREANEVPENGDRVARLVAILDSPLSHLFEPVAEDTPSPGVAVIAIAPGSVKDAEGNASTHPIHAFVHSSETGECPSGQSILYLTTPTTPSSAAALDAALSALLALVASTDGPAPRAIWQLRYEQACPSETAGVEAQPDTGLFTFAPAAPALAFSDAILEPVKTVWKSVLGSEATDEVVEGYMKFEDREGIADDDD